MININNQVYVYVVNISNNGLYGYVKNGEYLKIVEYLNKNNNKMFRVLFDGN